MRRLKIKAGALQLTTFIIVVIALLLAAFILFVHTHKQFQLQSDVIIDTTKLADVGIDYTLQHAIKLGDTVSVSANNEEDKTLKVHRSFWGVFEQVLSTASIKNKRFQKIALVGAVQPKNNRTALYVQDNNKPLVVVGDTKIEGDAYLPKQGVKPGYIAGEPYFGKQLVYGPTHISSKLPELSAEVSNSISQLKQVYTRLSQDQFLNIEDAGSYSNSFFEPPKMVFSNHVISLINAQLTGHILVQSKSKIVIHKSSQLKDVILIAPEIEIRPNTKGHFQAIASKEILIGNNVQLNYPSALVVQEKQDTQKENSVIRPNEEEHKISIGQNAVVKGLVLFLAQDKPNNHKTHILLKENAVVYGELYNTLNTELQGLIYGSVFTNNFIANQSGAVYQNHMYNGTVNVHELSEEYIGLLFNDSKKDVMKWLY